LAGFLYFSDLQVCLKISGFVVYKYVVVHLLSITVIDPMTTIMTIYLFFVSFFPIGFTVYVYVYILLVVLNK